MSELTNKTEQPESLHGNGDDSPEVNLGRLNWFVIATISFMTAALVLAAYHFALAPKPLRIATLDMEDTLKLQQQQFATMIAKGQGAAAYDLASHTGPRLADAMKKLGQECGCVIMVSQAVVAGAPDLTARMQQLLGQMASPSNTSHGAQK
jgi:Type-F conjugative transfer system protein (TrbI_Ftype).